jgi:molecular chaperone IbpA
VTAEQNAVTVAGDKAEKTGRDFMYQDISTHRFKCQFNLADYVSDERHL